VRQVTDARGASVGLPDRVERVVSLVPSLTEWLVVAGVGERLVGVTDWCLEPADALAGLPRVRGTKNPDLAAIRRLEPDLVVANAEENRKLDVQRLEAALTAVFVTMPTTVAGGRGRAARPGRRRRRPTRGGRHGCRAGRRRRRRLPPPARPRGPLRLGHYA
jgi:ABC-type hemin transport system substrate-binding protein